MIEVTLHEPTSSARSASQELLEIKDTHGLSVTLGP